MNLTSESKFLFGITAATLAIVAIGLFAFSNKGATLSSIPTLSRQELVLGDSTSRGNKEAEHFLVEFSDFQCPACKAFKPVVDQLISQYVDKLSFTYRHFPLDQHPAALPAAIAAEAAAKQGKFWEMYDLLFENQETLSEETVIKLAENLPLNMDQYRTDSAAAKEEVLQDRSYGLQIGINSTPTFYLDGKKLILNNPADLKIAVDKLFQ